MKKYLLLLILFIFSMTLIGCNCRSITPLREAVESGDFIVDIEYSIITKKTKKFSFFNFSTEEKEEKSLSIEKKDGIYYLKNQDSKSNEYLKYYFFWTEIINDDNFKKVFFKYNSDLKKINEQISFSKSELYGVILRSVILQYGDAIAHTPSKFLELSIKTSNYVINDVYMYIKLFQYNSSTSVYLSMNYSFNNYS